MIAAWVGAMFGLVLLATPAWAHVGAELDGVSDTGLAEITFSFQHGCDGAATTALRIQIPDAASGVDPRPADGFTSDLSDTEFGWSGGSVPDGEPATFVATMQLRGTAGDVVAFPTIQQCGDEELAWIEDPTGGSDESERPSPSIVLPATFEPTDDGAAGGQSNGPVGPADEPTTTVPSGLVTTTTLSDQATPETAEGNSAGLIVFLVIVVVLVGGALYLFLSNRRPRPVTGADDHVEDGTDDGPPPPRRSSPH